MQIPKQMTVMEKLQILSDAAKYDVACTSSGVDRKGNGHGMGNCIAPGIIVTPLALDEFSGPRGDFYKNMFANCPAGRPGTADEVANVAELLMSDKGAFISGSTFLVDGGATASYFYGPLKPKTEA